MISSRTRWRDAGLTSLVVPILAILLSLAACSAAPSQPSAPAAKAPEAARSAPATGSAGQSPGESKPSTAGEQPVTERMIVRSATLNLVVADVDRALADVAQMATQMDGFVVSSNSDEEDGGRTGRAVIRVPSGRFDEAISRIKGMAARVRREATTAQDVTEEYVDQEARLRALRAQEDQYLELLKTARTVDDTLKVRQALGGVRQEIERAQGRMQFLQRSAAMSSITVDLRTSAASQAIEIRGWNPLEVLQQAGQGLLDVLLVVAGLAIWVVVFVPIWVPALLLIRRWRRRRAAPAPAVAQPPPAA